VRGSQAARHRERCMEKLANLKGPWTRRSVGRHKINCWPKLLLVEAQGWSSKVLKTLRRESVVVGSNKTKVRKVLFYGFTEDK